MIFLQTLLVPTGRLFRSLFLRFLTAQAIGLAPDQVRRRIHALPLWDQGLLVGAAAVGVVLASLLFAEAGPGGPLAFWATLAELSRRPGRSTKDAPGKR